MFLGNLFILKNHAFSGQVIKATVEIVRTHPVFEGHFPGIPVLPGVCMIQLIKELVENQLETKLSIRKASQIKFISVINPEQTREVEAAITVQNDLSQITVNATLFAGTVTFFKLMATLRPV